MNQSDALPKRLELIAVPGFPNVEPGDDIAKLTLHSLNEAKLSLHHQDIIVVAQKVISKAENRYKYLNQVFPGDKATELAHSVDKDPRLVQLILDESTDVIRQRKGVVIVEHKLGYVHANAGIDQSNITSEPHNPRVLLLPEDSDRSAEDLRKQLVLTTGKTVGVIINDSAGRAWRNGTIGFAIGSAGFDPLVNLNGQTDMFGRELRVTEVAVADELAAAASFLMGQAAEALPIVIIRGANLPVTNNGSKSLIRSKEHDMFR